MTIASVNPTTGKLIKAFEPLSDSQLAAKLQQAIETFSQFRKLSFPERARMIVRVSELLEAEKETLARLMTTEMGKTYRSAVDEAAKCAWTSRFYAEHAQSFLADEVIATPAARSFIRYQPLGPILAIMPWNYPFWQVFRFAAPALMAGNVVLLKHAPNVPQCALAIEDLFHRAGFPAGAFQSLLIEHEKVDTILEDSRVMAATLTGSERAGIQVGVAAAKRVKKVVLELGGSDPFIVMPSADLDQAVTIGVKARTQNNGQSCIAGKRFILHEKIADEFERKFVAKMETLVVGDPMDEKTDVGPLVRAEAVTAIEEQVRKSVAAGARILAGGRRPDLPGFFYPPTVLTNIPHGSPAHCEELFGPVANLYSVKSVDEAIELANDTRYGLGASVWTRDQQECGRFIDELDSGMVFVNQLVASDARIPFGGIKRSGHGRELGVHGIREFTNIKTVWIQGDC
jgi:succinate-semialdehyde dehydrogenase/glutarate-semialdehyde dehydrogenase